MDDLGRIDIDLKAFPMTRLYDSQNLIHGTLDGYRWTLIDDRWISTAIVNSEFASIKDGTFRLRNDDKAHWGFGSGFESLSPGKYTYSFELIIDSNDGVHNEALVIYVLNKVATDATKNSLVIKVKDVGVGKWTKCSKTIELSGAADWSDTYIRFDCAKGSSIRFRRFMMVSGENPSSWGPASGEAAPVIPIEIKVS